MIEKITNWCVDMYVAYWVRQYQKKYNLSNEELKQHFKKILNNYIKSIDN